MENASKKAFFGIKGLKNFLNESKVIYEKFLRRL